MDVTVTIFCHATDEFICQKFPLSGMTDLLVNYYCDNSTPREVYDACLALADQTELNEDTSALEAFLDCEVTFDW